MAAATWAGTSATADPAAAAASAEALVWSPLVRVTETFSSLRGEGTRAGCPCGVARFTGCDLRCVWRDTAYAFEGGEELPRAEGMARLNLRLHKIVWGPEARGVWPPLGRRDS